MANKDSMENIKVINPDTAFEEAFKRGLKDPEGLMYMYTKDGKHFFKDSQTRKYKSYKAGGQSLTDLSGDGKITQKDVLIGRGVLPKPKKAVTGGQQRGTRAAVSGTGFSGVY